MHFWWPYTFDNILDMLVRCTAFRKDKSMPKPLEELKILNKTNALFQIWSINAVGPFPWNGNKNSYLLIAIDLFSKWLNQRQ